MGIFASFLDLLWPSRKADPAPQPLPPRLLEEARAYEAKGLKVTGISSPFAANGEIDGLSIEYPTAFVLRAEDLREARDDWKPWPPAQFDAASEAKLKKLASSRTREPVQVKPWSKPVRTPLGEFGSVTEAAEAHGIARSTLHEYLAKGVEGWERLPKPMVTVKGTRKARRAVVRRDPDNGLVGWYESVTTAAKRLGRSTQTIHRWCKAGKYGFRYAD